MDRYDVLVPKVDAGDPVDVHGAGVEGIAGAAAVRAFGDELGAEGVVELAAEHLFFFSQGRHGSY